MVRILVCGDLHTKLPVLQKAIRIFEKEHFDKIVFLGDYVDDWNTPPEASYNLLIELLRFKKQNPDKVILLLGNHDLSEWLGEKFKCAGYNPNTHMLCYNLFQDYIENFQIAWSDGEFLYTHAGLTQSWANDLKLLDPDIPKNNPRDWADYLNDLLRFKDFSRWDDRLFHSLSSVGPYRGGFSSPSPLWADKDELIKDPIPNMNQIVGHSPVKEIIGKSFELTDWKEEGPAFYSIFFCDTHSTYPDGKPYGSGAFYIQEIMFRSKI